MKAEGLMSGQLEDQLMKMADGRLMKRIDAAELISCEYVLNMTNSYNMN